MKRSTCFGWTAPVLVLLVSLSPARAQFSAVGGVVAPAAVPPPVLTYGGYGVYGGYGTQWMQNPYQGYLDGAASVTTANAQYQMTIQQAKLAREEARRSSLETRRQTLLERQFELSLMPDPEQIRQKEMMKSLERSRNNPPLIDIWKGTALNDLLRDIQTAQSHGISGGEDVPLSPDVLKHINVNTGTTRGGVGLLRDDGKLTWPAPLRQDLFDQQRGRIDELLQKAVQEAHSGPVDAKLLRDLRTATTQLGRAIDASLSELSSTDYIDSSRYLRELKDGLRVLEQSDVAKYFSSKWTPRGSTVGDLVRQMTKEGLKFGPAVSGDESYYTVLHRALVDYDLGMAQLAATLPPQRGAIGREKSPNR
jgi:hypothetical protein